mgnify:CR=1 FL=1
MFRKDSGSENKKDEYINVDDFNEDDLSQSIFNDETEQLIWLLDEIESLTDSLKSNISNQQISRVKGVAEILLPCFEALKMHENQAIRKYCKLGMQKINKLFPDLRV